MFRLSLLSLFLVPMIASAQDATSSPLRPNIVVIMCDDMGYGDLACYGNKTIQTPNLDKFATEGMRFTNCYAGLSVCSPSRGAMLTGRNPYRYGIRDWIPPNSKIELPPTEITVASMLNKIGYRTAHVGKWHLNSRMDGNESTPGTHGFEHWFSTQNNAAPTHENPTNFIRNGKPVGPLKGNSSTIIVDEAIHYIGASDASKPLGLFVWFHAPHEIVATPMEYMEKYSEIKNVDERTYYGSITLVDHEVGRLLAELDKRKMRDNTLVIFTSDNGPETLNRYKTANHSHGSPGPLRGMKLHLTEGGLRVPGMMRWPNRIKAGQTIDEPIAFVDLLPTVCGITRMDLPEQRIIDGTNITPLFDGKKLERKSPLFWQYDRALGGYTFAMRDGDWKILADAKFEKLALYDLKSDPTESKDLSSDEPDRLKAMKSKAQELKHQINLGAIIRP